MAQSLKSDRSKRREICSRNRLQSNKCQIYGSKHPTQAFVLKCQKERDRLEAKISKQLESHLITLFQTELFADILIVRTKLIKKVHSSVLFARIPQLFQQLLNYNKTKINCINNEQSLDHCIEIPFEIQDSELLSFLRKVYSDQPIEKDENDLIEKFNKSQFVSNQSTMSSDNKCKDHKIGNESQISEQNAEQLESEPTQQCGDEENVEEFEIECDPLFCRAGSMVRSGTFELLTSISSNDCRIEPIDGKQTDDQCEQNSDHCDQSMNNRQKISDVESGEEVGQTKHESDSNGCKSYLPVLIDKKSAAKQNDKNVDFFSKQTTVENINDSIIKDILNNSGLTNEKYGVFGNNLNDENNSNNYFPQCLNTDEPKNVKCFENIPNSKYQKFENINYSDIPLLPMSPIIRRKFKNEDHLDEKVDMKREETNSQKYLRNSEKDNSDEKYEQNDNVLEKHKINNERKYSSSISNDSFCDIESKSDILYDEWDSLYSENSEISLGLITEEKNDYELVESIIIGSFEKLNLKSCSKLGEDLLKLFVKQINTDIIIKVEDYEIKAHKCILSSRCKYFEAMLTGNWRESDSQVITLKGFSYNCVYYAFCHLYSGTIDVPTHLIDLSELALLSDLLAMDSLKDIVIHELKMNYCHFFHNPCDQNCIIGVLNCLALCSRASLNQLSDRCLEWTAKHFGRVWSDKNFALLSPQLMDKCYSTKINLLNADNVLNTTLECEKMITSMPRIKWSQPVFGLLAKLMEENCNFIANNYDLVIKSDSFKSLGRANSWNISSLEQTLLAAMTKLTPDISCHSHLELSDLISIQNDDQTGFGYGPFNPEFAKLINKMLRYCERYMIQNANSVVHCKSWSALPLESQQRIKDAAVLVFEFEKATAPPPRLSSSLMKKSIDRQLSPKSNDKHKSESLRYKSKGAVPKSSDNKLTKHVNNLKRVNHNCNQHVYDSVPVENICETNIKSNTKIDQNMAFNQNKLRDNCMKSQNENKVAKVVPFNRDKNSFSQKSGHSDNTSINDGSGGASINKCIDLMEQIDAESNLVTHCLQEAELLEQQLTKKLQNKPIAITYHTKNSGKSTSINQLNHSNSTRRLSSKSQNTNSKLTSTSVRNSNKPFK